jgi:hypothetical protein
VFSVTDGTGWQQITAQKTLTNALQRGNVGSRRERRRTPHTQWVTSHTYKEITHRTTLYKERLQQVVARKAAA